MSNNVSQSPSFHLSKTPPKLTNKQVFIKHNNTNINKPTKRSRKSSYNNMLNGDNNTTSFSNNNRKPMKVVHISNPIRYQATAAEFRALVQGLTGRDAVVDDKHFFGATAQQAAAAVEGHHDDDGGSGGANSSSNDTTTSDDDNNINNNEKVVLLHNDDNYDHNNQDYYYYHHQQQQQQEVNMSASCFGPSDHLSFDYYGAFNNNNGCEFVVMEDLTAFMDDYGQ